MNIDFQASHSRVAHSTRLAGRFFATDTLQVFAGRNLDIISAGFKMSGEAGGDMELTGSTLTNRGAELFLNTSTVKTDHVRHWASDDYYNAWTISRNSSQTLIGSVPGIIGAGGTLIGTFTDRIDNVNIRQRTAPLSTSSGATIQILDTGNVSQSVTRAGAANASVSGSSVARVTTVNPASPGASGSVPLVISTITPNTCIPNNSLYHTTQSVSAHYLIETDPQFASYHQWLSSDTMLAALALDPATTQKRLGDGFYEQRLISEQVAQLTGRRFLDGYAGDEAQYAALMNAGVAVAKDWKLVPGVALSEAQMAALTTDIVWLVSKTVTLADGTTQQALVPQVYVRVQPTDLVPSTGLLAGNSIDLKLTGDLTNRGTIAGRQLVSLTAENIQNLGGRVAGENVLVAARNDLANIGGTLQAENQLIATAGHDLTVKSTTRTQTNAQGSRTNIDRVAGLYVTGEKGTLVASAGNDLTLLAAAISNAHPAATDSTVKTDATTNTGGTLLIAGHDLTLGTVSESVQQANARNGSNYLRTAQSSEVGTTIQTTGDLSLQAGNNLTARAASVTSDQGALTALAGNDLTVTAVQATASLQEGHKTKSHGFLSSKTKVSRNTLDQTTAVASTFSGNTTALQADHDIKLTGSNVVATGDTTVLAGHDIAIESATEQHDETHFKKKTKSGLMSSGGVGFTIGSRMQSTDQNTDGNTAAASTIGSTEGNVLMQAGHDYRQIGSDVIVPQGSIGITAQRVDIEEARERSRTTVETKFKQSGLTVALSNPVISAIQTVQQMSEAASDTKDTRTQLLAATSTGFAAYNAGDAVKTGQGKTVTINGVTKDNQVVTKTDAHGDPLASRDATAAEKVGGLNVSVSFGTSKSQSTSTQTSDTAVGSNLLAGKDIQIVATGAGQDSDITIQGSRLAAGNNLRLKAEDELKLLAAANTADQHSTNKSSSGSIGFSYGTGGLLFNVGASTGKGKADGADLSWTNTHVDAGQTLSLESGGDTTLKGAVATGQQVIAKIGGDLTIESLQDTSTYDSKQKSGGFSLSVGAGAMSGSLNYNQSTITSNYASVTEQSGLKAGDGGFQDDVTGDTELKGAVITSTQKAIDDDKNRFKTATLTTSDIQNHAEYEGKETGVNLGAGLSFDGKFTPSGTGAGNGHDSGSASSTTASGISGIAGHTNARTGDKETGIAKIFDAERVQKEIDAQTLVTQTFGQLASKAVGDYAASKLMEAAELRAQGKETEAAAIESQWGAQGTLRLAAHTIIGGLTGGVDGAAGSLAGTLTAPLVAKELDKAGITGNLATTLTALASTAAGGLAGGTTGAGTALNEVTNNYLTHDQIDEKRKELANCKNVADCKKVEDKWKAIDQLQTQEALMCLANGICNSVMMTIDDLKQIRDQLQKDCVSFCSADSLASLKELNGYFLPNGEVNKEALRTGNVDWVKLTKSAINLGGSVAGVGTGVILVSAGGALVLAPEPTGVSKVAGATTAVTGLATLSDSSYGLYSSLVNAYRATQGSVVYLPDSGFGWMADQLAHGNETAQDAAQIGSLSLALLSGRVYVGTTLIHGESPLLSQYVPATIDRMLDARAAAPTGAFRSMMIPNPNYGTSTASKLLNQIQWAQILNTDHDLLRRFLPSQSSEGGQK